MTAEKSEDFDKFDSYFEADVSRYSTVKGKYFYGNGDWYEFEGDINEEHGGGALKAGDKIDASTSGKDAFDRETNETGFKGWYELTEVGNHSGHSEKGIAVSYYYDKKTKLTIDPHTKDKGLLGLGSEAGWLTSKISEEKDRFSNYLEAGVYSHIDSKESFDLRDGSSFLRTLTLVGDRKVDGFGNDKANVLKGNHSANLLDGFGGDDTLRGERETILLMVALVRIWPALVGFCLIILWI